MENSCPQCKKKIHRITYYDILGREKHERISDKTQEVDNFEDMHCVECRQRIYEANFDAGNRTQDTSAICEECLDFGKHLRCMGTSEREFWE